MNIRDFIAAVIAALLGLMIAKGIAVTLKEMGVNIDSGDPIKVPLP